MLVAFILIIVILLVVIFLSKNKSNLFIAFGLIDIFLRLMRYLGDHTIKEVHDLVDKLFPSSIPAIIDNYTSGIVFDILMWVYFALMCLFFYHVLRLLMKRF